MAVGDIRAGHSNISDAASLTIDAPVGGEAVIHNIYAAPTVEWELYRTEGSNTILIQSGSGPLLGYVFHVQEATSTNVRLTLKNVSGGSAYLGYDGIVTK